MKKRTEKDREKTRREIINNLGLVMHLGVLLTVTVVMCVLFGVFLDRVFSTKVLWTSIFSFLGMLAAFRNMYYYTMRKK